MSTISTVSNKAKKILTAVFQLLDQSIEDSILLKISLKKMQVSLKRQTAIPQILPAWAAIQARLCYAAA